MERTLELTEKILQVVKDSGLSSGEARAALTAAREIVPTIREIPHLTAEQQADIEAYGHPAGLAS